MSTSIFTAVLPWNSGQSYSKYDIKTISGEYIYCNQNHTVTPNGAYSGDYWGGFTILNGQIEYQFPNFIAPSYGGEIAQNPTAKVVKFGDGYEVRQKDNIFNKPLELNISFDNRSEVEAKAILHFLNAREGVDSFLFTPPSPYATEKRFVCDGWNEVPNFKDNHSIKGKFREVTN